MRDRHAGINVPLTALRSRASWGIGEIGDLPRFAQWLRAAGMDRVLVLPLGTMAEGQASPYSAVSTLAIDPVYISPDAVEDFARAGGIEKLSSGARQALSAARASTSLALDLVRQAKHEALHLAFEAFHAQEWEKRTNRADALRAYIDQERAWLDDYALFQALCRREAGKTWRDWPPSLRDRDPGAIEGARLSLAYEVLEEQYLQWTAETQWRDARARAHELGVHIIGDLPFVANTNSPEVWARQQDFRLDVSTGVPPDAFSATGQDWGLPFYHWDEIARGGFAWMHTRAARMSRIFDGLRVDHVVGLYRTYGRPLQGEPFFAPADERAQTVQGETVLKTILASGLEIVAEDLGVIPDFVRASLARLDISGCKILRWERDWDREDAPFLNPASYATTSAAMTGTHDTTTLAEWWRAADVGERAAFLELPDLRLAGFTSARARWTHALRDAVLRLMYNAGSRDLFFPVQDVFGWADRINLPGTVSDRNWTWCLPWPIDELGVRAAGRERARFLNGLARETGRGSGEP